MCARCRKLIQQCSNQGDRRGGVDAIPLKGHGHLISVARRMCKHSRGSPQESEPFCLVDLALADEVDVVIILQRPHHFLQDVAAKAD